MTRKIAALTLTALSLAASLIAGPAAATLPSSVAPMSTSCYGSFHTWPVGYSATCYTSGYTQFRATGACAIGPVWPGPWVSSGRTSEMTCPLQMTGRPTSVRIQTR